MSETLCNCNKLYDFKTISYMKMCLSRHKLNSSLRTKGDTKVFL